MQMNYQLRNDQHPLGVPDTITTRQKNSRGLMMCHLNVNSTQYKFEDISRLINDIKAHVVFLTQKKIDASASLRRLTQFVSCSRQLMIQMGHQK